MRRKRMGFGVRADCVIQTWIPANWWNRWKARLIPYKYWELFGGIKRVPGERRVVPKNDVKAAYKNAVAYLLRDGSGNCARRIRILDNPTIVDTQNAALAAGGDGTVNYARKDYTFTNGGSTDYTIDVVQLLDYLNNQFAEATLGAPVSYPVGGQITVQYTITIADWTDAVNYPGVCTNYITYELAEALGADLDTETIDCGGHLAGTFKMYYTQAATPYTITAVSKNGGITLGTDTTDAILVLSADFYHAAHNAVTVTKLIPFPTDGVEAHAVGEQTANFDGGAGPHDLTATVTANCFIYVSE